MGSAETAPTRRLLFLFLDGVGLGAPDPVSNPFAAVRLENFERLAGGPLVEPFPDALDARLGHPGLPQSATGQATLLTGTNAAALMAGHYGPWPGPTIRSLLERGTLFSEAGGEGRAVLANAYPPPYLASLGSARNRGNVPVRSALSAGLRLLELDDYGRDEAVAADLTGEYFATLDPGLPVREPEQSGVNLARIAARHTFTFFDFWLSDRLGHRGTLAEAAAVLVNLDRFLAGVLSALGETTIVVTSDHGNLEDLGSRGHTLSPVPLLTAGPGSDEFAGCRSLLDVAPAIRRVLGLPAR